MVTQKKTIVENLDFYPNITKLAKYKDFFGCLDMTSNKEDFSIQPDVIKLAVL